MSELIVPDVDRISQAPAPVAAVKGPTTRLQVINEKKEFSQELLEYMKKYWDIGARGFDYHAIAVFGSQSTGKSTLLNKVFGTSFDVMNETQRSQTTKGIWLSRAQTSHILVMDVEGTDGRERGEDQDFERKSALFSLATSEVLLINMFETQVGLYNGANMGLLKTVFDVNLHLFQQQSAPKTLLLFIVRDFTEMTPLKSLSETLVADLNRIWLSLRKPPGKENSQISDFFEFKFFGLPHKVFASQKFDAGAAELRTWFTNPESPDFVFKPLYHKHIPADGFPRFAESIWEKIVSNRDLDLPSQQQLLAQYRCDEILRAELLVFNQAIAPLRPQLESGKVLDLLGESTSRLKQTALENFDKDGSRYHEDVYKSKRFELVDMMNTTFHVLYVQQLRNLHKRGLLMFQQSLQALINEDGSDFATGLDAAKEKAEDYFKNGASAAKFADTDWESHEFFAQFKDELEELGVQKRKEIADQFLKTLEASFNEYLSEPIELYINEGRRDLWRKIITSFSEQLDEAKLELLKKLQGFGITPTEISAKIKLFKRQLWEQLNRKLKDEMNDEKILLRLRNRFQEYFRYDDHGIPRVWRPGDDIDKYFIKSKEEADKMLSLFAKIDVPISELMDMLEPEGGEGVSDPLSPDSRPSSPTPPRPLVSPSSLVLLLPAKLSSIKERFKRECDAQFLEAKRSTVAVTAKTPVWMFAVIAVLGWNEFLFMLSYPLFSLSIVFSATIFGLLWVTGFAGPVWIATKAAIRALREQISDKTMEVFAQDQPFAPTGNHTARQSTSYGRRDSSLSTKSAESWGVPRRESGASIPLDEFGSSVRRRTKPLDEFVNDDD